MVDDKLFWMNLVLAYQPRYGIKAANKFLSFLLSAYGDYRNSYFTRRPEELRGQFVETHLVKTSRGLGFTIVGGDDTENGGCEEFLQIKNISPNSPAAADGKLCRSK